MIKTIRPDHRDICLTVEQICPLYPAICPVIYSAPTNNTSPYPMICLASTHTSTYISSCSECFTTTFHSTICTKCPKYKKSTLADPHSISSSLQ